MKNSGVKRSNILSKTLLTLSLLFATSSVFAMKAPEVVVKDTFDRIVTDIQQNRAAYKANNEKLYAMVERELIPALHVQRMANLILGKKAKATPAQRAEFADQFKTFMMRTYAVNLLEATGREKVSYQKVDAKPGADKVIIRATLTASDGQAYPIKLYMSNRRDTQWRAYNMEVAGINMIQTYRNTFGPNIAKNGVDGLIKELKAKNARTS